MTRAGIASFLSHHVLSYPPETGAGAGGERAHGAGSTAGAVDRGDAGDQGDQGDDDGGDQGDAGDQGDGGDDDRELEGLSDDYREMERSLDGLDPDKRYANAKTRLRRYARSLNRSQPILEQLRDAQGQPLNLTQVQRMRALAADMEELEQFFQTDPEALQYVIGRKNKGGGAAGGGRETADEAFVDPYADESKVWFDTTTDAGQKFLAQLRTDAKDKWELRQEIKRLRGGFEGIARTEGTRQDREIEGNWKTAALAAAKQAGLSGDLMTGFVNAVYADYRIAKAEKRLGRVSPQQVVERHLGFYRRLGGGQRRAAAADTSRRVANNGARPGPQRRGSPTTATDTGKTPGTIKDARKSFFERIRGNAAARS
jgi:hypothetical protein